MAVYNTSNFGITVAGPALTGIATASVTLTLETVDVTEIGGLDRKFVSAIRTGTASGSIFYDQGNAQIAALEAATQSGNSVALVFTLHSGATYTVPTAYVTSFVTNAAVADVVKSDFSIQFSGTTTIA